MPTIDALAHDLAEVARGLRQAGDTELRRELLDGIQHAAAPVPDAIRQQMPGRMPNRYAATLDADLNIGVVTRTGSGDPGVSIRARTRRAQRRRLKRLDDGVLAHPLFGNRRHWYDQPVREGWFTQPAEDSAPRAREDIEAALARVEDKIFRGAHG